MADDVLHHHHRAINDEAEINRAQAHQVAGHADSRTMPVRANSNDSGIASATMSAARQLPSSGKQHDHHEQRALEQILLHRGNGAVHQVGAVVERADLDARRQFLLNLRQLRRHVARDDAAVPAGQHHAPRRGRPPRRCPWPRRCG